MATNSLDFKVKNGLVVSTTATIRGTTESNSSITGALIVDGGVGIQKNLHVGGTITGDLSGTATSANNLTGGNVGSIPYQNGTGTTTFLGIGNNNYVLASNGTTPTWQSLNSLGAGSATTATNIAGGSEGQVPYQTGSGATAFTGPGTLGQLLVSAGTTSTGPVFTNTSSIKVGYAGTADLALTADVWTNARTITLDGDLSGNISIDGSTNVTLTATINADSIALGTDTTGIYVASGATSGYGISGSANTEGSTFTVSSNATSSNTTSTIVFRDSNGGFSAGNLNIVDTTVSTSTQSGAVIVRGGTGIGGNLFLGGNLQFETEANQTAGLYNDETTGRLIFGMVDNSNIYGAYFSVFGNQWADTTQRGGAEFIVDTRNSTTKGFTLGRFNGSTWTSDFKMNVDGSFDISGITNFLDSTNSTSTQSGGVVITGGVGIGKKLTVGEEVKIVSATSSPLFDTTSGALVITGGVAIGENLNVASDLSAQNIRLLSTTDSSNLGQGALIVDGGASIGKKLNVGDIIKINTTTNATSTNSGSLQTLGGIGVDKDIFVGGGITVGGQTTVTNTINATSTTTGALKVTGGASIGKDVYVGGNFVDIGNAATNPWQQYKVLQLGSFGIAESTSLGAGFVTIGNNIYWDGSTWRRKEAGYANRISFGNGGFLIYSSTSSNSADTFVDFNESLYVDNSGYIELGSTALATSTSTGALRVKGGVGIGEKLYVASSGTFGGDLFPATDGGSNLGSPSFRWGTLYVTSGTIDIGGATIQSTDGVLTADKLKISGTDASTSTTTGALVITGGVGVGNNVWIGGTAASTTTITENALYVEGGAGIKGSLYVTGKAVFAEDVLFTGTATYVFSTNTVYTDNILNIHTPSGGVGGAWAVNDGKDIGLIFHNYVDGADNDAFFGWAADSGYLEWYDKGTESTTGTFTASQYGIFKTGGIRLVNATVSNSTDSGAFQVVGGTGIGGDLNVGGNTTITGDLAVNGGDITSSAASFNLINTNVTTLNFVGAGTAITIGATSGSTTIRNQLVSTIATNASSTQTGAIVISGGVGIGKDIHIGGTITLPEENHSSFSTQVSSASPITVDTWSTSTYRTAKYIAQITQGTNYQSAELLVVHNGTDAFISEYAIVRTNTNLGTFTADVNSNNVRLRVTMNSASAATIKLSRILINV